ncbi:MAG: hypothetical protein ACT4TC_26185 [Myxococcaceae bacterium]
MSPEARSVITALTLLRREIAADRQGMLRQISELGPLIAGAPKTLTERPWVVVAAVCLHGWYTALETALERIARTLDGRVPEGPRSHVELLEQLSVEMPGIRPEVVPGSVLVELHELRKFRHFFRNAYNVELDPVRIEGEARRLLRVEPELTQSLDVFDSFLAESLRQLAGK